MTAVLAAAIESPELPAQQVQGGGLDDLLDALAPSSSRMQALLDSTSYTEAYKRAKVRDAYLQAASAGQLELLEWMLASLTTRAADSGPSTAARDWLDIDAKDDNDTPAVVLAALFGHSDAVRLIVDSGCDIDGTDARGWTALFWAFQKGDLPLSSFLINRRAKTSLRSHTGLTAADLIRKGSAGEVFRGVLHDIDERESTNEDGQSSSHASSSLNHGSGVAHGQHEGNTGNDTPLRHARRSKRTPSVCSLPLSPSASFAGTSRSAAKHTSMPPAAWPQGRTRSASLQAEQSRQSLRDLAVESARCLEIDASLLCLDELEKDASAGDRLLEEENEEESDGVEAANSSTSTTFDWNECLNEQMLSFSMEDLPALLDLVTESRPSRAREVRNFPANALFLAARYASRYGGEDLLGELLLGAIDRIEASVHENAENLANSAYWLSNAVLLLYHLRKDAHTAATTLEYQDNLYDIIRQIFVFCIRDVERRLDKILDISMLEHEALPGYDDVRFEGEWRLVKALTSRSKKDSSFPLASGSASSRPSVLGLFGSPDRNAAKDSLNGTPLHATTGSGRVRTPSMPAVLRAGLFSSPSTVSIKQGIEIKEEPSPKAITTLLSSTLFILQHYDYAGHPAIVTQAFSQLLYWLASELFNRILSRKRYLCRSKAVQIRLNVSALEEWARTNHMPSQMVASHFRPLNELLQWLQCLSSEESIDGLLDTLQNVQALNPVQLRKAVKDYRHEVEETKMSEECSQYLLQVQKDWERRRLLQGIEEAENRARESLSSSSSTSVESQRTGTSVSLQSRETSQSYDPRNKSERHVDDVFGELYDPQAFLPQQRPESTGELLDSRIMLPFSLPTINEALLLPETPAFGPSASRARGAHSTAPSDFDTSCVTLDDIQPVPLIYPEPSLPQDILERLAAAKAQYGDALTAPFDGKASKRQRANVSAISAQHSTVASDKDDYWLNWRSRMEQELEQSDEVQGP